MMLFVSFVLTIFLVQTVDAANVGIVVEFPDGSVKTDCVPFGDSASGYDILQQSIFNVGWSDPGLYGRSLCKIDGVGDEVSGTVCVWDPNLFWAFYILDGSSWQMASVGTESYVAVDKDVLGFVRSGFDAFFNPTEEPPVKTYEQVCDSLQVKNIKVYVDGKKESGADEDGGKIDVVPGSKLELKIEVESLYGKDEDTKIEDIIVEGVLEGIDDDSDLDDEANDFSLKPEKEKEVSLNFDIPLEVEEGDYDLIVTIEGENENAFSYLKEIEFDVEVDKEKHDIIFNKLKLSKDNVECGKFTNLEVKVVNLGVNDETVRLVISNDDLGISIQEYLELDEDPFEKDNSFSKTYKLELPLGILSGTYLFRGDLFYGSDIENSIAELNVACEENVLEYEDVIENTNAENVEINTLNALSTETITGAVTNPAVVEKKSSNKDILMAGMFAGEIIILIAGVGLLIHLLKK